MSLVDKDLIWRALGDFYDLFPPEERVYWNTFWDAYADIAADLWGLAYQVDRSKSVFATTATFERREVLVKLSNLVSSPQTTFRVGAIREEAGRWLLRGFAPTPSLPTTGTIRLGSELIDYSSVNIVDEDEATFTLASAPLHDYGDDPDFNDDFIDVASTARLRVAHEAGERRSTSSSTTRR